LRRGANGWRYSSGSSSTGELYSDLGAEYFERRQVEQLTRRAIRQLERLGHQVILTEAATPQIA